MSEEPEFPNLPKKFFLGDYPFPETVDEILGYCLDKKEVEEQFNDLISKFENMKETSSPDCKDIIEDLRGKIEMIISDLKFSKTELRID